MATVEQLDYLCIGHVTRDLTPAGPVVGGTAAYSSLTAQALGLRAAVLTSAEAGYSLVQPLAGIPVALVPAGATTTFENIYTADCRRQIIHGVAGSIGPSALPPNWNSPNIVHLGPMAREVESAMWGAFPESLIGLTPQGMHRTWGDDGRVHCTDWSAAEEVLPLTSAVVVSIDDIHGESSWALYHDLCQILVITEGASGCQVYAHGQRRHFPAPAVEQLDPTGVGDIFAAAFFVRLWQTGGDPWEAARFATQIAAPTVTRLGLDSIPTGMEIETAKNAKDAKG